MFATTSLTAHPILLVLSIVFFAVFMVQMAYLLGIFTQLAFYKTSEMPLGPPPPPVSLIVCAHNEFENLSELLPLLHAQDYPVFELIVVNDRSTDQTRKLTEQAEHRQVRFIHVEQTYDHVTPKKYALTTAIRQSKHQIILLTDADCRPASPHWIAQMVAQLTPDKDIVLGFSPYYQMSGFLNRLIRFETFYGAVQYFSLALWGKPYMGVGRNLLYRKEIFLKNKGFYTHLRTMGGDDDLLMNEIANSHNTNVCLHPDSFVYSIPKTNWTAWFRQKKRHLSVSKHYKRSHKWRLAFLSGSHVLFWLFFGIAAVASLSVLPQQPVYLTFILATFVFRLLVQWLVLGLANRKLGAILGWYAIPFFDFVLFVYYLVMSVVVWRNRKKTIQWR